jgi:general secretion pathway protein D
MEPAKPGALKGSQPPKLPRIPAKIRSGLLELSRGKRKEAAPVSRGKKIKVESLVLDKADIAEVTNLFFGKDFLNYNYVLDPTLRGTISLYLEGEYTKEELLGILTKAYNASNVAIIKSDGIYYIQPIQRSSSSGLPIADRFILREDERGIKPSIVIYRLRFLDAKQAVNVIRFFLTPGRPITIDTASNSIIFAEETENARTLVDLLRALDMDLLNEVGMEIVPLQALSPEDAVKSVETLINKLDVFKQTAIKSNLAFLPLEQFGGVIILSQDPKVLKTAKEWLLALDVQGEEIGEQIYVYFVQNGLAVDIADILTKVFEVDREAEERRPGQQIVEAVQQPPPPPGQQPPPGQPQPQQRPQQPFVSTRLTGEVAIIADEVNNAIIVKANPIDYEKIKKAILALDIVPRVVQIEVTLAEVRLQGDLEYGVQWFINKQTNITNNEGSYLAALRDSAVRTLPELGDGITLGWASVAGDIQALINLLSTKTDVNVLSTPTLLATDNKEATINIGGREPVRSGTTVTSGGNVTENIQYEETGIILTVTPHINAGGLVRMEVEQTVRRVADATTEGIASPRFDERIVNTTLLAQDGQTIVIGGLIERSQNRTKKGIPLLGDIPFLGPLFASTSKEVERIELIIAMTPRIVRAGRDEVTQEFLYKLEGLRRRIEAATDISRP